MTNEEAIKWLNVERQLIVEIPQDNSKELKEAYDMAIKALEQEPILDKIKAEIIELRSKQNVGVLECLDIIDKYITELNPSYNSVKTELKFSEDCVSRAEALKHSHIEYDDDGEGHRVIYVEDIEDLPSITPTRPHKGVWIPIYLNDIEWGYKCSNCKETWLNEYNYCPECGCRMEVDDEEN